MLQPKLTSEPAENLRGAYVKEGEFWVLDKLSEDHPVVAHNKTLVTEKSTVETELNTLKANIGNIERERDEAKQKTVPAGYRTVTKADAELLDAIKPLNLSKDELATLKTRAETAEASLAKRDEDELLAKVASATKRDVESLKEHAIAKGLKFETKEETVDGKPVTAFVAVRKEGEAEVKTAAIEYFDKVATHVSKAKDADDSVYFPHQKSVQEHNGKISVEAEMQAQRATGRYSI